MTSPTPKPDYALTWHALDQMNSRRLSADAVNSALAYGRHTWTRGAVAARSSAFDRKASTSIPYEGVQVMTQPDGTIVTVYRNRDLRRLRQRKRSRSWRRD